MNKHIEIGPSTVAGIGVFARNFFKPDEFIIPIEYCLVRDHENLPSSFNRDHLDILQDGTIALQNTPAVYVNHCCDPNCYARTVNGQCGVYAMKPIEAGQELFVHYSISSHNDWVFECNCGSPQCLGKVPGNFFKLPKEEQLRFFPWLDDWFREEYKEQLNKLKT